jgi:hypothetical protein
MTKGNSVSVSSGSKRKSTEGGEDQSDAPNTLNHRVTSSLPYHSLPHTTSTAFQVRGKVRRLSDVDNDDVASSYSKTLLLLLHEHSPATATAVTNRGMMSPPPPQQQQHLTPASGSTSSNHRKRRLVHSHAPNARPTTSTAVTPHTLGLLVQTLREAMAAGCWSPNRDIVQEDCLVQLGDAAFQSSDACRAIGDFGGCFVLVQCLAAAAAANTINTSTISVRSAACLCLANITAEHTVNRQRIAAAGGAATLVSIIALQSVDTNSDNNSDTIVHCKTRALTVLDNLAASPSCQAAVAQANTVAAVCRVMTEYPAARDLQLLGCRILGRLAEPVVASSGNYTSDSLQSRVQQLAVTHGGLVAVASAFQRFYRDAEVAETATAAIHFLMARHVPE